jgi:hypothetical protein
MLFTNDENEHPPASIRQPAQMIRGTTPARITEVDESENEACPTVNTAFAFADPDDWTTGSVTHE